MWAIGSLQWSGPATTTPDGMLWLGTTPVSVEADHMSSRAEYARHALAGEVRPVLCVVGAQLPQPVHRINGVDVVDTDWLVSLLTSHPTILSTVEVDAAIHAATRWRVQPPDHVPERWVPPIFESSRALPPPPPQRFDRDPRRVSASQVMIAATVVAVSMLGLIGYLLTADRGTVSAFPQTASMASGRVVVTDVPGYGGAAPASGWSARPRAAVSISSATCRECTTVGFGSRRRWAAKVASAASGRTCGGHPVMSVLATATDTTFSVRHVDRAGSRRRGATIPAVTTPAEPSSPASEPAGG
ncbi:MAG: hypothetical protein V9G12_24855 [Microthrixaceae bacterium]